VTSNITSEFQDSVVLVTGGVSSIGREISCAFARAGAKVSINYYSNSEGAESLAEDFEREGVAYLLSQGDVGEQATVKSLVDRTMEKFGRIDILINNSGIHRDGMVWKLPMEGWEEALRVNLTAPFTCIKEVLPHMRRQGFGRIATISSIVAYTGAIGAANYAAAKAGLAGLTRSVALEAASRNVTVNLLVLGYMALGMGARLTCENREQVLSKIPAGRFGNVDDIVHAMFFLTSRNAGYVTGQTLHINGGMYMGA